MKARAETVTYMAESTFLDQVFHSLPGKILIVIIQTVLSSLLLLLTFTIKSYGDITLLKYTIVLVVGLLAGFAARRILAGSSWALKTSTALMSTALSLALLYILSGGFLGIRLSMRLDRSPDWSGLIQLGTAALGILLVVTAFRAPLRTMDPPAARPKLTTSQPTSIPGKIRWPISLGRSKPTGDSPSTSPAPRTGKEPSALAIRQGTKKTASLQKVALSSAPKTTIKKPAKKTRAKKKEIKEIKLFGEMEHTCPYCLDVVEPHDPRGVKVCRICKTHHHADCWGITGACQIPHSQEKS